MCLINMAHRSWVNTLGDYSYFVINTRVYTESFFAVSVIPFDYAHDLRATVTTAQISFKFDSKVYIPASWEEWKLKVMSSFKLMANFFLAPVILASPWGTTWHFLGDGLDWSEVTGTWEIIENAVVSKNATGFGNTVALEDGDADEIPLVKKMKGDPAPDSNSSNVPVQTPVVLKVVPASVILDDDQVES